MSTAGALLLTISLTASVAGPDKLALPDAVIEAGLKKAGCTVPPEEAQVIGIERLSSRLEIVEVTCWRSATNAGSILFAVPEHRPDHAQLLAIESWQDGRILRSYSVSSPGFDPKTRTLSFSHKARGAGACGTIQDMNGPPGISVCSTSGTRIIATASRSNGTAGTGGRSSRDRCPRGRASSRFPKVRLPAGSAPSPRGSTRYFPASTSLSKCPRDCSHQSSTRLGSAVSALSV